jgi:hypothetical protein
MSRPQRLADVEAAATVAEGQTGNSVVGNVYWIRPDPISPAAVENIRQFFSGSVEAVNGIMAELQTMRDSAP